MIKFHQNIEKTKNRESRCLIWFETDRQTFKIFFSANFHDMTLSLRKGNYDIDFIERKQKKNHLVFFD